MDCAFPDLTAGPGGQELEEWWRWGLCVYAAKWMDFPPAAGAWNLVSARDRDGIFPPAGELPGARLRGLMILYSGMIGVNGMNAWSMQGICTSSS